jgi:hypothetical protein
MSRVIKIALVAFAVLVVLPPACTFATRVYAVRSRDAFLRRAQLVQNTLPLPGGAVVETYGAEIYDTTQDRPRSFVCHARYRAPGAPAEFVGSWQAGKSTAMAHVVGSLVVVIPGEDYFEAGINRIFVRTAGGRWKETQTDFRDISDGADPPDLTSRLTSISADDLKTIKRELGPREGQMAPSCWLDGFSAERAELMLSCVIGETGGRLVLKLTEDGETWRLQSIEHYRAPASKGGR